MRSRLPFIMARTKQAMGSNTIIVKWTEIAGGTTDPLTGSQINGTATEKTLKITGLVHFVSPVTNGVRLYNELAIGDAIVDIDPDFDIVGKEDLTFEFANARWAQKEIGKELAKAWDVLFGDQLISRTLLLSRDP